MRESGRFNPHQHPQSFPCQHLLASLPGLAQLLGGCVFLEREMATPAPKSSPSPFLSIVQLLYLHIVLLLALFGASDASGSITSKTRGGCPISRLQTAFQTPFNSLSMALHGPTASSSSSSRPWGAAPSLGDSSPILASGGAAPRWVTAGASVSRSARVLRSRKVDVLPLGMSAVETKQGNKRAAESEPESSESKAEKKARRMAASSTPLGVHVIGLSHHNAGVDVREKLAVPEQEWNEASAKV